MSSRSQQRREAVFALYQHDLTAKALDDLFEADATAYTRALAYATLDRQTELDRLIGEHADGWTIERIAPLERSILRVALMEMLYPDEAPADKPIPPEGAINEAVETAKLFCSLEAPAFINGLLDAVLSANR